MIETDAAGKIMFARRALFAVLFLVTMVGSLCLAALALSPGGFGIFDVVVLGLFAITLPWMVAGFCNALIGFVIMRFSADPVAAVLPAVELVRDDDPVTASTAILLCVRNELPERTIRNLAPMLEGLCASGYAERFHLYLLSDTGDAELAIGEEAFFSELIATWGDRIAISYRRRTVNSGFKAGNIRDFCERWGNRHEFAITLDADSFMPADAIIRLVQIMQVDPKLGILQGLIVGLPSTSLFARIFQFGMRLGMRSYTIGSAWWQGDCGPYWGHNAILRLKPFTEHCQLPLLARDGEIERHILSHDQIEAALMRAAGYHVRVLPREDLGWEDNPPTLLEFMRRDLRWCQGNMQYWRLVTLPNLTLVSRYQLVLAILMFIGSPAWVGLLGLATAALALCDDPADVMRSDIGSVLLLWILVMWFSPKIAGALDVLLAREERRAFGGAGRFIVNFAIETGYSIILCPILWISHTIFLFGRLFHRDINWMVQIRDDHAVPFELALRDLWPQTLVGCLSLGLVMYSQPWALPYILLLAGGPACAAPFATVTAWALLGGLAARTGIGRLPEETAAPEHLLDLALPAIKSASRPPLTSSV
ncbi:glucans biosynthesis glucosyltransferase MdoH [Bradyrhizobium sp. BWA-3-5]|uniref:glucans biosynthesis glucosyltransferase MdoH n=1 Tax=Bradyrhizobium sp. BWA-3-5 TaxID=3080013 RepID=UPI00293EB2E1|nr:glucans biosynthesis glucosyltransferase MdoH [Bradyrhizobium sp. BWA-3-5]WOH67901.1 glucans biosynthesis glucosyltransferase MdoH [Bradyrhizobium sp. BWA-3-5]